MGSHRQPRPTGWWLLVAALAVGTVAVAWSWHARVPEHPEPTPRQVVCVDELVTYRDGTTWWTCRGGAP